MTTIINGDCLHVLREMPDNSVDAVITDPPYGLSNTSPDKVTETIIRWASGDREYVPQGKGFMGAAWDGFVPPPAVWDECYRVLKPGGHMAVFAGTRTMDLMTLGIRLAGFDIRDSLAWLYGSGFPKSQDVGKAIDKANGRKFEDRYALGRHIKERRAARGFTRAEVNAWVSSVKKVEHYESQNGTDARVPTLEDYAILKEKLGLSDEFDELVERVEAERQVIGPGRWNHVKGDNAKQLECLIRPGGKHDETAPATDAAKQWSGWGTALKPAFEPIILARKPFKGTVAANVTEWGTGAINIDSCRITPTSSHASSGSSRADSTSRTSHEHAASRTGRSLSTQHEASFAASPGGHSDLQPSAHEDEKSYPRSQGSQDGYPSSPCFCGERAQTSVEDAREPVPSLNGAHELLCRCGGGSRTPSYQSMPCNDYTAGHVENAIAKGRFPANVVLDQHTAQLLDQQSGISKSPAPYVQQSKSVGIYGAEKHHDRPSTHHGDQGGASRFFHIADNLGNLDAPFLYSAKAPKKERPAYTDDEGNMVQHATVKPLKLMTWLVKLITPPGGTVLDPFAGSGTTVEAALLEGFNPVGIEAHAPYIPLIEQRVARAEQGQAALNIA